MLIHARHSIDVSSCCFREQIKQRRDRSQIESTASKISADSDQPEFSLTFDQLPASSVNEGQPGFIEQHFPNASTLGPSLLVPSVAEDRLRLIVEHRFAKEQTLQDHRKQLADDERLGIDRQAEVYQATRETLPTAVPLAGTVTKNEGIDELLSQTIAET